MVIKNISYFYNYFLAREPNFHNENTFAKIVFDCELGVLEDVIINDVIYSRIKINYHYKEEAIKELNILMSLQGTPLIPKIFGFQENGDSLWILFEKLGLWCERPFSDIDMISMLLDSVRTLRLFESRGIAFRPMRPQTCLFNEKGSLKFLDISQRKGGSLLSALFTSSKEIMKEVKYVWTVL